MKNRLLGLLLMIPMVANCQTFSQSRAIAGTIEKPASSRLKTTKSGGVDAGGGNLCYIQGQPVLLEFADLRSRMTEPGIQIEKTAAEEVFGLSQLHSLESKDRLESKINQILDANERNSPVITSWFRSLVRAVPFSFVSAGIMVPVKADTSLQPDCQHGNVRASIVFLPEMIALVDRNQFNALDLDSQAGLVLHEGARMLQRLQHIFAEKYNKEKRMSDLQLQLIVRHMFDVYLGSNLPSLDSDELFNSFYYQPTVGVSQRETVEGNVPFNIKEFMSARLRSDIGLMGLESTARGYLLKKDSWFPSKEIKKALRETQINACNTQASLREWLRQGAPKNEVARTTAEVLMKQHPHCTR